MSYRAPYPTNYGGSSMPMPSIPGVPPQPQYKAAYQPPAVSGGYPQSNTPYPVSTPLNNNIPYPGPTSQVTSPTSSEIDDAMKQLTDDLVNGFLKDAQNSDLESLIENDMKFTELIADSQISKNLTEKRKELGDFNRDLATQNLALKPEFEILRAELSELAQKQNELRDRYLNLQNKLGNSISSDAILSLLQVAAGEQETLSEDFKTSFYDGDLLIDEFIKSFVDGRKLYQLRKIRSDKLKTLVQQPPQHGGGTIGGGGGFPRAPGRPAPGRPAPPVPGLVRGQMGGAVPNVGMNRGYGGHQSVPYGTQYPSYPR